MQTTFLDNKNFFLNGLRISTSAGLSVFITGSLFLLMYTLIAMEPPKVIDNEIKIQGIVMPEERVIDVQIEEIEKKPPEPTQEPDMPEFVENFENIEALEITMRPTTGPTDINPNNGEGSGEAMPIFKVAPQYPRRALTKGIEGFVELMFDITTAGKTENIRVIYAEPKGYFERNAVNVLAKWKYKPALDDGIPQPQRNQTTRITYELEK